MSRHTRIGFAFLILFAANLSAQAVWAPRQGRLWLTPAIQAQGYGAIWRGPNQRRLPSLVTQFTGSLTAEYGLTDKVTVDFSGGYTRLRTSAFGGDRINAGMSDLLFGVRRRVFTPGASKTWVPAISLRAGGMIGGTYEANAFHRAGIGASGADFTVLFGTGPTERGLGTYGDIGIRARTHPAPAESYGSAGLYQTIGRTVWSGGYRHKNSLSGPNVGEPGFSFPALKEVRQTVEAGVGVQGPGRRFYQFFAAKTVHGRNTGRAFIAGVAVTFRL